MLTTALEIIDHDGADALSMRRLGAALDRDPMILYRHAPGKAALLDGVVESCSAQLHVDPAAPAWAAQLRGVARDYRALALEHPNVVPLPRSLAHALASYDGAAELERGLDILLTGQPQHCRPQVKAATAPGAGSTGA